MPVEFRFNGKNTFEDYLECHQVLASKRRLWIRGIFLIYGTAATIYGLYADSFAMVVIGIFGLAYAVVISPFQFKYRVRKNWENYPAAQKPGEYILRKDGISIKGDDGNFVLQEWDNFISFRETKSLFMLYLSPLLPIMLPKRILIDSELSDCREFLKTIFYS